MFLGFLVFLLLSPVWLTVMALRVLWEYALIGWELGGELSHWLLYGSRFGG